MTDKRTIKEIINQRTGEIIISSDFFQKPQRDLFKIRKELEIAYQNEQALYTCSFCGQMVKISGGHGNYVDRKIPILHFSHFQNSDECEIKTNKNISREEIQRRRYQGARTSELHVNLVNKIGYCLEKNQELNKGVQEVKIEERYYGKEKMKSWKTPDIYCIFNDIEFALELQLSTTFLDVIVSREKFYAENGIYILWVLRSFDTEKGGKKFTDKDVVYSNRCNAFVFDEEMEKLSNERDDLHLKCYYEEVSIVNQGIGTAWRQKIITLSDLKLDEINKQIYFYDTPKEYKRCENELERITEDRKHRQRQLEEKNRIENLKKTSKLIQLFKAEKIDREYLIRKLFTKGYKVNSVEKDFLNEKFHEYRYDDKERFYQLCLSVIYSKFESGIERTDYLPNMEEIILATYSMKFDQILKHNFGHFIQLANHILEYHEKHATFLNQALIHFRHMDVVNRESYTKKYSRAKLKGHKIDSVEIKIMKKLFPKVFTDINQVGKTSAAVRSSEA